MQCVTPMYREYIPYSPEEKARLKSEGKKQWQKIVPREKVFKELTKYPNMLRELDDIEGTIYSGPIEIKTKFQTVACKHCWACDLNYSANWANRIMCECMEHEQNYFITLTYNDEELPIPEYMTYGEEKLYNDGTWTTGTLYPDHVTKFIDSLRTYMRDNNKPSPRYFYCGEYGELGRPHYHMILFNCELDVSQFYEFKLDQVHKKLHWKSKELEHYWGREIEGGKMKSYGFVDVAECEWNCAAYVARYCMKKLNREPKSDRWYFENGKQKEFIRMSNRPGIGMNYFKNHIFDMYRCDELIINVKGKAKRYKPPFDKKFQELYPEEYEKLKISRQEAAKRNAELQYQMSDYTDKERLQIETRNILTKANMLPRVGEW